MGGCHAFLFFTWNMTVINKDPFLLSLYIIGLQFTFNIIEERVVWWSLNKVLNKAIEWWGIKRILNRPVLTVTPHKIVLELVGKKANVPESSIFRSF